VLATQLVLGETTVRTHGSSILGKLQLASRTQAALYALREGHATRTLDVSCESPPGAPRHVG
jgi:DNA-binding NarL/FixJ family response regulator